MLIIDGLQYPPLERTPFENMRKGGVNAVHITIAYWETTQETLHNIALWQRFTRDNADLCYLIKNNADLEKIGVDHRVGIIFGFQNCSPISDNVGFVEIFHDLGVRFMQLTYNNQTRLASGTYEAFDTGLTRFGKTVVKEMNRVGMVVDMSHSGERSTLEAIEFSDRPITVSHANPKFYHDGLRNQSLAVIKALGQTGGMLGFSLYPLHLKDNSNAKLDEFCTMIAKTAEIMGVDNIGIGTDLCVGQPSSILEWMRNGRWSTQKDFGESTSKSMAWPAQPDWFTCAADFSNIAKGLTVVGFNTADIEKIMGGNWQRFFHASFGPAA